MQVTTVNGPARRLIASIALASIVVLGGALVPTASATLADGDVQLQAQPAGSCVAGTRPNCENVTTGIANAKSGYDAFYAVATGNGAGLHGYSDSGYGIIAQSNTGGGIQALGGTNGVSGTTSNLSYSGVSGGNLGGGYGVSGSTTSSGTGSPAGIAGINFGSGPGVLATSSTGEGLFATASSNAVHGQSSGSNQSGVWGENQSGGYGVSGSTSSTGSTGPAGVWGSNGNSGPGVLGTSGSGRAIFGDSTTGQGVFGQGQTGVTGFSSASNGAGVSGQASSPSGIGVLASNPSGQGLKVTGKATFTGTTTFARSGTLIVPAGSSQATKSSISLNSSSLVMTTIQGNVAGVYVQGATTVTGTSGSFTVHLNKPTPTALTVAWLIAN